MHTPHTHIWTLTWIQEHTHKHTPGVEFQPVLQLLGDVVLAPVWQVGDENTSVEGTGWGLDIQLPKVLVLQVKEVSIHILKIKTQQSTCSSVQRSHPKSQQSAYLLVKQCSDNQNTAKRLFFSSKESGYMFWKSKHSKMLVLQVKEVCTHALTKTTTTTAKCLFSMPYTFWKCKHSKMLVLQAKEVSVHIVKIQTQQRTFLAWPGRSRMCAFHRSMTNIASTVHLYHFTDGDGSLWIPCPEYRLHVLVQLSLSWRMILKAGQ